VTHHPRGTDDLQHRLDVLEAAVARLQVPGSTTRRLSSLLGYGLVPPLALAGLAIAQQPAPAPGTGPAPLPPGAQSEVIRRVDGITQVRTPFQVVDGAGEVVLSVGNDEDEKAAVAIYVGDGAGALSVQSSTDETVAELGTDQNGNGILRTSNAAGTLRAGISGEGLVAVFDQSGEKRLVALGTNDQAAGRLTLAARSGKAGVDAVGGTTTGGGVIRTLNANGHAVAELRVASSGTGRIVVHNAGGEEIVAVGASANGKGGVSVFEKGQGVATLEAGDSGGGQLDLSNAKGTGGVEAYASDVDSGGARIVVFSQAGEEAAEIAVEADGKGKVGIAKGEGYAAALTINESGAGSLTLQNAEGGEGVIVAGSEGALGGVVVVLNSAGEDVAGIAAGEDGKGRVSVAEKDQQVAVLKAVENGAGMLVLTNAQGKNGVEVAGQDDEAPGGAITVFNQTGDDVVSITADDQNGGVVAVHATDDASAELSADRLDLFDGREPVVSLESDPGQLTVFAQQGEAVNVGLSAQGAGQVVVSKQGKRLAGLGETPHGGGHVSVFGEGGKITAGLQSRGGTGLVAVTNANGDVVSEMSVVNERGQVVVWNPGGRVPAAVMAQSMTTAGGIVEVSNEKFGVASLSVSTHGAGLLELTNSSGQPTVQAGTMTNGNGRVQAGPSFKCAPGGAVMALAILDCIVGRQQ
jgi:hypothetical protein